jgi:hypothetical protein
MPDVNRFCGRIDDPKFPASIAEAQIAQTVIIENVFDGDMTSTVKSDASVTRFDLRLS